MPTYVTKVRNEDGSTEEQMLTVPTEDQLNEYLARVDGFVVDCTRYTGDPAEAKTIVAQAAPARTSSSRIKIPARDLVAFTWYLYTLVEAGVPLLKALQVVGRQMESEVWQEVLATIVEDLKRGESFGETLRRFPRCFPKTYIHLVEVGELSGQLDAVLKQLALHGEKQMETRAAIRSALAYPTFLIFSCLGVTCFLVVFVLPRVAKMFTRAKLELPTVTSWAMAISGFIRENALLLGVGMVVGGVGLTFWLRTPKGMHFASKVALHFPILGGLYQKYVIAGYCRTLALLNRAGVSLLVSLEVARNGLSNVVLRDFFGGVEANLQEGEALGDELAKCPYIPEMVSSMVSVGEETGRLADMLQNITRFYERDIDQTIQVLPKIVEPLVIVAMTGVVGLIASSVFIPLSKLTAGVG